MTLIQRLTLLLPLLLTLWHAPVQAKLRFGEVERLRHVATTTLTDSSGATLYLARKIVEKHFLLPYALDDQGYVLGVSGDSRRYYPLPAGEKLAALQQAGHLPTPLPPYKLDTIDLLLGHALWVMLVGFAVYGGAHWAWKRRRAAQAGPALQPSWADAPSPPVVLRGAPPPLGVTLPLRLHPRRLKMLGFLAICLVFVVIGVVMFKENRVMGALCAGFFGLGIPIFVAQMLPGASFLELHADRFTFRTLFKQHTVHWRDVAAIAVVKVQGRSMVGWNHGPSYAGGGVGHKVSRAMSGVDAALPESYGMAPTALAELMERIRLHHRHPQPSLDSQQPTPA
jgi:hypothetical protein